MLPQLLLQTTLLATLTSALSIPSLHIRAGGPASVPIPSDCTVPNPLPCVDGNPPQNYTTQGYTVSPTFLSNQVYSFYLPLPDYEPMSTRWETCLEQCNGLEGCVSAFIADGLPTPKGYFGTAGGQIDRGCLMFNTTLAEGDFVVDQTMGNATAGNIECPASS